MRTKQKLEDLYLIREHVESQTGLDIETDSRRRPITYARTIYYKLALKYTTRSTTEIAEVVNKTHTLVNGNVAKHLKYAMERWANVYHDFNPMVLKGINTTSSSNYFAASIDKLNELKQQMMEDAKAIENETLITQGIILEGSKNRKALYNILRMIKGLDREDLIILHDRIEPIVKMMRPTKIRGFTSNRFIIDR